MPADSAGALRRRARALLYPQIEDFGITAVEAQACGCPVIALAAGGANAVNMVVDRDIDALMERTMHRPLVRGVMTPRAALVFAVVIEVVAFVWLFAKIGRAHV